MSLRTPLKLYHPAKKKIARTRGLCRLWAPGSLHVSCKISLQEVKRGSYGSEGPDECSKDTETVQEYVFFSMAEHDSSHCWWYSMDVVPGVNKGIGSTHCACYRQRHRTRCPQTAYTVCLCFYVGVRVPCMLLSDEPQQTQNN